MTQDELGKDRTRETSFSAYGSAKFLDSKSYPMMIYEIEML